MWKSVFVNVVYLLERANIWVEKKTKMFKVWLLSAPFIESVEPCLFVHWFLVERAFSSIGFNVYKHFMFFSPIFQFTSEHGELILC